MYSAFVQVDHSALVSSLLHMDAKQADIKSSVCMEVSQCGIHILTHLLHVLLSCEQTR